MTDAARVRADAGSIPHVRPLQPPRGTLLLDGTATACEDGLRESVVVRNPVSAKRDARMADDLVFMMGKFEARIPGDRAYSENHLWLQRHDDRYRVGFTSYSVRLLQDVYFLEWSIDPDTAVKAKKEIGEIESSKAVSTLYAPGDGRVLRFNESLLDDPSAINTDNYGKGWLYEFQTDATLLTPDDYVQHLDAGWEKTQTHLKGQIN